MRPEDFLPLASGRYVRADTGEWEPPKCGYCRRPWVKLVQVVGPDDAPVFAPDCVCIVERLLGEGATR